MPITDENYLQRHFINQAKPALDRHSGSGPAPEGEIEITENGTHDVTEFATAKVQVGEAGPSVNGYDIATMQKLVDARPADTKLAYLFYRTYAQSSDRATDEDYEWVSHIDVTGAIYCDYMFYACKTMTKAPLFDTSKITSMRYMFSGGAVSGMSYLEIPAYDTSNVRQMNGIFNARYLTKFPQLDYSNVTEIGQGFNYAIFQEPNREIGDLNFPKVTYAKELFSNSNLTSVGNIALPKCTNIEKLFCYCSSLVAVGDITSEQTKVSATSLFESCKKLTTVGQLPDCNYWYYTFRNCESLTVAPRLNSANATSFSSTFSGCKELVTVPYVDARNSTSLSSMFYDCVKLQNLTLKNIKSNLQVGSGDGSGSSDYGHLLTVDSLVGLCYELRDTGSSKTLTVGSANLEKLANVYIREITITDEMRAADDLIDEKLPFEVCESTDEGATLISNYVMFKNWQLK